MVARFKTTDPQDEVVLWDLPPLPKTKRPPLHPLIVDRILDLRQNPLANLNRIPG